MPVMDGFTMTNNLRTLGVKTPILILTADASAAVKVTAKNCGGYGTVPQAVRNTHTH